MKNSLYARLRVYTYLVILTLAATFVLAAGAFYHFESRIESQLHRSVHFHARSSQLAIAIQRELLAPQALLEAHHAPSEGYDEAAQSDVQVALSMMPTALYNVEAALETIIDLQREFGDAQFDQTIGKVERGVALLERLTATSTPAGQAVNAAALATALDTLILSAGQLERLHLVVGGRLNRRIDIDDHARISIKPVIVTTIIVPERAFRTLITHGETNVPR